MLVFPNCKINIGLHVVRKRSDGFHDIETVFYPLGVKDAIEILPTNQNFHYSASGQNIDIKPEDNLCIKAYHLLKKYFPQLPPLHIHLHKTIPIGAGLGGGSADGAFTLKLLDQKFDLNISEEKLMQYALQLGSDCPFFIINQPCYADGRGEVLEKIKFDLSSYKILLVHPDIHSNTAWAFSQVAPALSERSIKEIIRQPIETWKTNLKNDLEEPVYKKFPEIKKIKESLYNAGAIYSSMSGSGSAVFGIFKKEFPIKISFPENYFVKELSCEL